MSDKKLMDFSSALLYIKAGEVLARASWGNHGKYVYLQAEETGASLDLVSGEPVTVNAHLAWRNDRGEHVPWAPSQDAVLANDWFIGVSGSQYEPQK